MNKRNIDFTPKEALPAALLKSAPEIIILPPEWEDGRYLFIGDICRILGISRSSAYRLIDKLHDMQPDKGIREPPGQISKENFVRQLYNYTAGKDEENGFGQQIPTAGNSQYPEGKTGHLPCEIPLESLKR